MSIHKYVKKLKPSETLVSACSENDSTCAKLDLTTNEVKHVKEQLKSSV